VVPINPTSNHYQLWGNAGVLSQAAKKNKNSSRVKNALQLPVIWFAVPEKAIN